MAAIRRYELTNEEWERIEKYFPMREAGQKGRPHATLAYRTPDRFEAQYQDKQKHTGQ